MCQASIPSNKIAHICKHYDALFVTQSIICGTNISHKSQCAWGESRVEFPTRRVLVEKDGNQHIEVKMSFKRSAM